jgi:hypothetical protein
VTYGNARVGPCMLIRGTRSNSNTTQKSLCGVGTRLDPSLQEFFPFSRHFEPKKISTDIKAESRPWRVAGSIPWYETLPSAQPKLIITRDTPHLLYPPYSHLRQCKLKLWYIRSFLVSRIPRSCCESGCQCTYVWHYIVSKIKCSSWDVPGRKHTSKG